MNQWLRRSPTLAAAVVAAACGLPAPTPAPPLRVATAEVLRQDVPVFVEAIGETRGSSEVEVRARVEGILESVDFQEGRPVREGQPLYTIDARSLEAALAQARGSLAEAEARMARARQDVARYEPLVIRNAISRQEYDTAVAIEAASRATVDAAGALVRRAEIDLGYARVTAPVSGLAGKSEVDPGSLVGRGESTLLTTISRIDAIHVRFTIAEREFLRFARRREKLGREPGDPEPLTMELTLADGSAHPHPGELVFVDREVDPRTGTLLIEASFPNPGALVRPGQFARVRALVEVKRGALLVPERAVIELQGTHSVALVGPTGTVEVRQVTPAERVGGLWVIDAGLQAGERVVVEGLQKVRHGATVEAHVASPAPKPEPSPGVS